MTDPTDDKPPLPAIAPEPKPLVDVQPAKPPSTLPVTKVGKISGAIAAVMGEIGIVPKGGTNRFHNYKYAQMQDVLQHLTPLLAKHGLVIWQTEVDRSWLDGDRVVQVQYSFRISHSSGEVWPEPLLQTGICRARDSKGGFDDKAVNKCHTAARKYMLLALFQIPTGDVDDADAGPKRAAVKPAYNDAIPDFEDSAPDPTTLSPEAGSPAPPDTVATPPSQGGAGAVPAGTGPHFKLTVREMARHGRGAARDFRSRCTPEQQQVMDSMADEILKLYPK